MLRSPCPLLDAPSASHSHFRRFWGVLFGFYLRLTSPHEPNNNKNWNLDNDEKVAGLKTKETNDLGEEEEKKKANRNQCARPASRSFSHLTSWQFRCVDGESCCLWADPSPPSSFFLQGIKFLSLSPLVRTKMMIWICTRRLLMAAPRLVTCGCVTHTC